MKAEGVLEPGDAIIVVDELGQKHNGLVTAYHDGGMGTAGMACNAIYVASDKAKYDPYGQQVERLSSLQAKNDTAAHGRYYLVP
jgi:hypothetical protein